MTKVHDAHGEVGAVHLQVRSMVVLRCSGHFPWHIPCGS